MLRRPSSHPKIKGMAGESAQIRDPEDSDERQDIVPNPDSRVSEADEEVGVVEFESVHRIFGAPVVMTHRV